MSTIEGTTRGAIGSAPPIGHTSSCRLEVNVSSRIRAILFACHWGALTPEEKVRGIEGLAGWAGEHLGVVLEHGCGCGRADKRWGAL